MVTGCNWGKLLSMFAFDDVDKAGCLAAIKMRSLGGLPRTNSALESSGAEKVMDGFPWCTPRSRPGRISAIKDPDYPGLRLPLFILSHPPHIQWCRNIADKLWTNNLTELIPWIKTHVSCHRGWHVDMMSSPPQVMEARVVCCDHMWWW